MKPAAPVPTDQPHPRVDGRLKVTGVARYAAEFKFPGLAYAALVQSTIPAGRIKQIATTDAQSAPGVLGVLTSHNMPRLASPPADLIGKGQPGEPHVPLQDDVIHGTASTLRSWSPKRSNRPKKRPFWSGSSTNPLSRSFT